MKKLFCLALVLILIFSFTACGGKKDNDKESAPLKIHTPNSELKYSEYEIYVTDEGYEYMGLITDIAELVQSIEELSDGQKTFLIIDSTAGSDSYLSLCNILDEMEVPYQDAGKVDNDKTDDGDDTSAKADVNSNNYILNLNKKNKNHLTVNNNFGGDF